MEHICPRDEDRISIDSSVDLSGSSNSFSEGSQRQPQPDTSQVPALLEAGDRPCQPKDCDSSFREFPRTLPSNFPQDDPRAMTCHMRRFLGSLSLICLFVLSVLSLCVKHLHLHVYCMCPSRVLARWWMCLMEMTLKKVRHLPRPLRYVACTYIWRTGSWKDKIVRSSSGPVRSSIWNPKKATPKKTQPLCLYWR